MLLLSVKNCFKNYSKRKLVVGIKCEMRHSSTTTQNQVTQKVAVIGAGVAGLVTARELLKEGHDVKVFEQGSAVGGIWVYNEGLKAGELNGTKNGLTTPVHRLPSSVYKNLRTNLPREIMAFSDFPFHPAAMNGLSIDDRRHPVHQEVLAYLQAFTDFFQLDKVINLSTQVVEVNPVASESTRKEGDPVKWKINSVNLENNQKQQTVEEFDAVAVCNGHFSKPFTPDLPGQEVFPGSQMHSYFYRKPEEFKERRVLVLGWGPSGIDIAFEVARYAECVYMCARQWDPETTDFAVPINSGGNIWKKNAPVQLFANSDVELQDGEILTGIDDIIYCTGYMYDFPFLNGGEIGFEWDNQYTRPLYKRMFHPKYGNSLSFIALPDRIVPFVFAELQSKWLAQLLSQKCKPVPAYNEMMDSLQQEIEDFKATGKAVKYSCYMLEEQFEYNKWLAEQCVGAEKPQDYIQEMFFAILETRVAKFEGYRDRQIDKECVQTAETHVNSMISQMKKQRLIQ